MQTWTQIPEAAALIADCAANPPEKRPARNCYDTFDMVYDRRDPRIRRLRKIADQALDDALVAGDLELAKAHCITFTQAIDEAIKATPARRAA